MVRVASGLGGCNFAECPLEYFRWLATLYEVTLVDNNGWYGLYALLDIIVFTFVYLLRKFI